MQNRASASYGYIEFPIPLDAAYPVAGGDRMVVRDVPIVALHRHACLELGYCYRGHGIFVIDEQMLPFRAGDVSVIGSRRYHLARSTDPAGSEWAFVLLDPEILLGGNHTDHSPSLITEGRNHQHWGALINGAVDPELGTLVRLLAEATGLCHAYAQAQVRGLALATMAACHARQLNQAIALQRHHPALARIAPALNHIAAHYPEEIHVDDLARCCGVSASHLRRLFEQAIACTPLAYIVRWRVNMAASLLRHTGNSVMEIAMAVGFTSISTFNRAFRSIYGAAPLRWRRQ